MTDARRRPGRALEDRDRFGDALVAEQPVADGRRCRTRRRSLA
jgi:hypothetical protein